MNKVFKVIWSEARNAYVVVSEIAKNHGSKSCSTKKLLTMLIATGVMTCASMAPAMAAPNVDSNANVTVTNGANITVTEGPNKDGGKEYKVALKNDITLEGDDPDAFVGISGSKGTIWTSGKVTAGSVAVGTAKADGTTPFFVDSNGAFYAADGKFSVDKDGNANANSIQTNVLNSKYNLSVGTANENGTMPFFVNSNGAFYAANGKLVVDKDGKVTATEGEIGNVVLKNGVLYKNTALRDGELYVGDADGNYSQITPKSAKLGQVTIDEKGNIAGANSIQTNALNAKYNLSVGTANENGTVPFFVNSNGAFYAANGKLVVDKDGKVTATEGEIGNVVLKNGVLYKNTALRDGELYVGDADGNYSQITPKSAKLGQVTIDEKGNIAGVNSVQTNALNAKYNLSVGTANENGTVPFFVNSNGAFYAANGKLVVDKDGKVTATEGEIGNVVLKNGVLYKNTALRDGELYVGDADGNYSQITPKSAKLGQVTIDEKGNIAGVNSVQTNALNAKYNLSVGTANENGTVPFFVNSNGAFYAANGKLVVDKDGKVTATEGEIGNVVLKNGVLYKNTALRDGELYVGDADGNYSQITPKSAKLGQVTIDEKGNIAGANSIQTNALNAKYNLSVGTANENGTVPFFVNSNGAFYAANGKLVVDKDGKVTATEGEIGNVVLKNGVLYKNTALRDGELYVGDADGNYSQITPKSAKLGQVTIDEKGNIAGVNSVQTNALNAKYNLSVGTANENGTVPFFVNSNGAFYAANGKLVVDKDGKVTATEGEIGNVVLKNGVLYKNTALRDGELYVGDADGNYSQITPKSAKLGQVTIDEKGNIAGVNSVQTNALNAKYNLSVGTANENGTVPFFVNSNGAFYAANGKLVVDKDGKVTATEGEIGNVVLKNGVLYKNTALRDGELYVGDADGNYSQITPKSAKLGQVTIDEKGNIAGANSIQTNALNAKYNLSVGTANENGTVPFFVNSNGAFYAANGKLVVDKDGKVTATEGEIGNVVLKNGVFTGHSALRDGELFVGDASGNYSQITTKGAKLGKVTVAVDGKISGVAAGAITADSTDAVNGSQLHAVATEAGKHSKVVNGNNTNVEETTVDGQKVYKVNLNNNIMVGDVTGKYVSISGTNGTIEATGAIATKDRVYADKGAKLADIDVTGDTISNGDAKMALNGAAGIAGMINGKGASVYMQDGYTVINSKVAFDQNGKISGVAAGAVTADSTDAVNGSQLHAVATEAGKHTTLSNGKNTTVTSTNKDGQVDYQVNVAGDLKDITSVSNGDSKINLNADSISISNGNKSFAITNSGIGMSYITADYSTKSIMLGENGTTISGGLNVAGSKITGVAAGVADTDAVNVGQLKEAVEAGNTDTHIKPGEYGVGADNTVKMDVVDKNGNKVDTVTIKDVAKASDVGDVNNIANDIKNKEGKTTVVDAVNNLNNKVGDLQYSKVEKGDIADGDSTTTAIGKLDQKLTDVAATAAKHTKVEGSSNIIVTNTAKEGEAANYQVKLNETIDVNTVTANSVTTGQTVMNNDGLKVGKDVSVTATAVTAGKTSISDEGVKVGDKTYISDKGLNANGQNITNVADGKVEKDSKDAINGGQLHQAKADINNRIDGVENQVVSNTNRINQLGSRVNKVGAGAAALAALHPMDFDPDDKLTFSAGYGNYGGENAAAIGAYYRPDEKVMFSVGGTVGNGENMVNAGVSFSLDRTNHVSNSRTAMAREILDLRAEVTELKAMVAKGGLGSIAEDKMKIFPDVAENHWAYEYVGKLAAAGIIEGYPDGNFSGDRMMSRYEFAAMLYRAMQKGAQLDSKIINEFAPEMGRIRVDRISGEDGDRDKIERVRVNAVKGERDHYGNKIAKAEAKAK